MKKKTLLLVFVAILLSTGAIFTTYCASKQNSSSFIVTNLEALLDGEIGEKGTGICYNVVLTAPSAFALHCGDCIYISGFPILDYGTNYCY